MIAVRIDISKPKTVNTHPWSPRICSMARAPSHATDVRLMKMNMSSHRMENPRPMPLLYRLLRSSGMVVSFCESIMGKKYLAMTKMAMAAISS